MQPPRTPPPSLRHGLHELRNVINSVQFNAYAACQLAGEPDRLHACLERIGDACASGSALLHALPADDDLPATCALLADTLREAGGRADVAYAGPTTHRLVPRCLQQALCLTSVECQDLGARRFVLAWPEAGRWPLRCTAVGLATPGPVTRAIATHGMAGFVLAITSTADGLCLDWHPD